MLSFPAVAAVLLSTAALPDEKPTVINTRLAAAATTVVRVRFTGRPSPVGCVCGGPGDPGYEPNNTLPERSSDRIRRRTLVRDGGVPDDPSGIFTGAQGVMRRPAAPTLPEQGDSEPILSGCPAGAIAVIRASRRLFEAGLGSSAASPGQARAQRDGCDREGGVVGAVEWQRGEAADTDRGVEASAEVLGVPAGRHGDRDS